MAVSRKSAAEFAQELEASIISRNATYDTKVGPIPDVYIQPTANVLELQNERIRKVQQLLSLINDDSFTDDDLDQFVFNESIIRLPGAKARTVLVFSRSTVPTASITVKANFPVATLPDESTGTAITFLTVAEATLDSANASAYFNSETQRYELKITAEAVIGSTEGNVGSNRVIRPLRPLNGFDTVFNRDATSGGRDRETNDQLIERYFLSLIGSSPAVVNGVLKILRDKFPEVEDTNLVFGNNVLNIRSATDGGAVDAYIIGSSPTTVTENIVFPGAEQTIPLLKQPVSSILSAGAYVQNTDFILTKTTDGTAGSVRALDGIEWKSTGSLPAVGGVVSVTYIYNALLSTLQNAFNADDLNVPSRDLLYKEASKVSITLSATLKVRNGFNTTTTSNAVIAALLEFVNGLKLSDDVEGSDLQLVVRSFSGVDNFVITNLARVGSTGTADIAIGENEYARLDEADLLLTVV